jgi:hypothetical protein
MAPSGAVGGGSRTGVGGGRRNTCVTDRRDRGEAWPSDSGKDSREKERDRGRVAVGRQHADPGSPVQT